MEGQQQIQVFEQVKQSMAESLGAEILSWDFATMLHQLQSAARELTAQQDHALRSFCRQYLSMSGDRFKEARGWLSGSFMSAERIERVLGVLAAWKRGELEVPIPMARRKHVKRRSRLERNEGDQIAAEHASRARLVLDHALTIFSSLMVLVLQLPVRSTDLCDGDRMRIRIALAKICEAFGIEAHFPEPEAAFNEPITQRDLAGAGLRTAQERKRR